MGFMHCRCGSMIKGWVPNDIIIYHITWGATLGLKPYIWLFQWSILYTKPQLRLPCLKERATQCPTT